VDREEMNVAEALADVAAALLARSRPATMSLPPLPVFLCTDSRPSKLYIRNIIPDSVVILTWWHPTLSGWGDALFILLALLYLSPYSA
jgi:hypothetical protein